MAKEAREEGEAERRTRKGGKEQEQRRRKECCRKQEIQRRGGRMGKSEGGSVSGGRDGGKMTQGIGGTEEGRVQGGVRAAEVGVGRWGMGKLDIESMEAAGLVEISVLIRIRCIRFSCNRIHPTTHKHPHPRTHPRTRTHATHAYAHAYAHAHAHARTRTHGDPRRFPAAMGGTGSLADAGRDTAPQGSGSGRSPTYHTGHSR